MKIILCFCLFLLINTVYSIKLNYPRVLLPIFDKVKINFTLEVLERGCFKWSSSRTDLIQITSIYDESNENCANKAIVTTVSREKRRNTAAVLVEDLKTHEILKCDVILDFIDQLVVLTTTRELYLEEAPETFELFAKDSQGNAFTTLEGIEFNWSISSQNQRFAGGGGVGEHDEKQQNSWQEVLRFLTFTESAYHKVPKSVEKLEKLGIKGYMVLLEGINSGSATVSVSLPYPEYSHIKTISVNIMILANIIIDPIDAHILVGDQILFKIFQLKQGKLQDISTNNQYYLEIENTNLATINERNIVTGMKLGKTMVVLRDRNVPTNYIDNVDDSLPKPPSPTATLTITSANKILLNLLPYNNWVTIIGHRHHIAVDLYNKDDQKILLGPRYKIDTKFDSNIFYTINQYTNGSRIFGEALAKGATNVIATFEKLKATAKLIVCPLIDLYPAIVIIPYEPNFIKNQNIQFIASGGDGEFVWHSLSKNLLSIDQSGLATTKFENLNVVDQQQQQDLLIEDSSNKMEKYAEIKVSMKANQDISKTSKIFILPPVKLEILKYNFETALDDFVDIHLGIYAYQNNQFIPFNHCENLNIELKFTNEIFASPSSSTQQQQHSSDQDQKKIVENSCRQIKLKSIGLGTTQLKISYKFLDKILSDDVTLVVFERLDQLNPIKNEIVLPLGASRNIIYHNGPQKIYNIDAELHSLINYDKHLIDVHSIENEFTLKSINHIKQIVCRKYGQTILNFTIFNQLIGDDLKKNFDIYPSTFLTRIYCVKPKFLNLLTNERLKDDCPIKTKTNTMGHLQRNDSNRDGRIEIEIEILDSEQRKLMNITSLVVIASLHGNTVMDSDDNMKLTYSREIENEIISGVSIPLRDYFITSVQSTGDDKNIKIISTIKGYNEDILNCFNIKYGDHERNLMQNQVKNILGTINFLAVSSILLPYGSLSIYLAKSRPFQVKILQGSGHYNLKLSDEDIIHATYDDKSGHLMIKPLRTGQVKLSLLDRCLNTEPTNLIVSVVSIGRIEVLMPDRVERTKSIEAIIKLYDSMDNLLEIDSTNLNLYELYENVFNSNILSVQLGDQNDLNIGEIRYNVKGLELGETKIIFNSGNGDQVISSAPVSVQVFPPLKLYPRNSTILIGSSIQIYSHGGPHPDINIIYSVQNENVISMDSAIATALKLGDTSITGKCIGVNVINGQQIIFSQDTINIYVVPFDMIKISVPLEGMRSGSVMPAVIWGLPNISPMILGTLPNLKVIWSTNQPDIISIQGVFYDAGIEYTDSDSISVRVKALNPGKARINAVVITPNGKRTTFVEVTVFQMPELVLPKRIVSNTILIPPNSNLKLKANLMDVMYSIDESGDGIVSISKDGNLKSHESVGRELIIASSMDQTLSIPVEVKNVHYILATLYTPGVKLKQFENHLPKGMNIILKITMHDNLGNEFSHNLDGLNVLKYYQSRKEIADIHIDENFTIAINLPREANGMLAVSVKDSFNIKYAEDFIKLSVAQSNQLFPTKSIFSVGDIICFESPLTYSPQWISSDASIITVDSNLGIGRIVASRSKFGEKVTVTNGDQASRLHGNSMKYELEIREADKIEFITSYDTFNGETYRGYLVIKNHLQIDKLSNVIAKNSSKCTNLINLTKMTTTFFTCKLKIINPGFEKILDDFKVMSIFDRTKSLYACEIEQINSDNDLLAKTKEIDLTIELEANLLNGISDMVTLKVIPAIRVVPKSLALDQLAMQSIIITGLDKVLQKIDVFPSDSAYVEVKQTMKTYGSVQYKVRMLNNYPDAQQLSIKIDSSLTQQSIDIPIYTTNTMQMCSNVPFSYTSNAYDFLAYIIQYFGWIICAVIILGATIWVFVSFFSQNNQKQSTNPEVFTPFLKHRYNSTTSSPASKELFNSSSNSNNSSTSTPPRGPLYPNLPSPISPLPATPFAATTFNNRNDNGSPVYGDPRLVSPQIRVNRRFM